MNRTNQIISTNLWTVIRLSKSNGYLLFPHKNHIILNHKILYTDEIMSIIIIAFDCINKSYNKNSNEIFNFHYDWGNQSIGFISLNNHFVYISFRVNNTRSVYLQSYSSYSMSMSVKRQKIYFYHAAELSVKMVYI